MKIMCAELEWFTFDLLENIGVLLIHNGIVRYVNKTFERIIQASSTNYINDNYENAFKPLGKHSSELLSAKTLESIRSLTPQECRIYNNSRCYEVKISPKDSSSISVILTDVEAGSRFYLQPLPSQTLPAQNLNLTKATYIQKRKVSNGFPS
jgi:nitrogen-specific signal transduction histidine kinase